MNEPGEDRPKQNFLILAAAALALAGVSIIAWPLLKSLAPAGDQMAKTIEVDISGLEAGSAMTVLWQSVPIFIRHRTEAEIAAARAVDIEDLIDPEPDEDRVIKPQYLVVVGLCGDFDQVPLGNQEGEIKGNFGGWFCPANDAHYDTSGRIRKGDASQNMAVPNYSFEGQNDETLVLTPSLPVPHPTDD